MAFIASSADCARTTGIIPTSLIVCSTSAFVISSSSIVLVPLCGSLCLFVALFCASLWLSVHTRRSAFHHPLDFRECRHRRVSSSRHRQCAVRRAAFNRPLWTTSRQQSLNHSGSKRLTAADTIQYLEVLAHRRLVKLTAGVTDSAPIVDRRRLRVAQRRRHDTEVRK